VFGIGGAEWLIIAAMAVFMLAPGALLFWLGYLTGKNATLRDSMSADESAGSAPRAKPTVPPSDDGTNEDDADA
jgi:hypothetical protein